MQAEDLRKRKLVVNQKVAPEVVQVYGELYKRAYELGVLRNSQNRTV